jgi:PAS domain S-box-containing protein
LYSHRHDSSGKLKPIPFDSKLAAPMRMALSGISGNIVGLDYRGEIVLAAYEPVAALNLGIVAKIDLSEIRAPFVRASLISGGLALIAIFLGSVIFLIITTPIIRKLQESEAKHRDFFQEAQDAILVADGKTGLIVDANRKAQMIWGKSLQEITQIHASELFSAEDAEKGEQRFKEVLEKGRLGSQQYSVVSTNGRRTSVEAKSNVVEFRGQKLIIAFFRDITDRKRAEEELRHSRMEWGETFGAMSDWVSLIDANTHKILRSNLAGEKMLGLSVTDIIGKTCCKIVHGSDTSVPGCPLQKMLKSGVRENMELEMPEKNIWLHVTVDPLKNEEGKIISAVHVVRDISERKGLEKHLLLAQKMEAIGTLAGGIAHDFNNILSAIIGYSELVLYSASKETPMYENVKEVLKAGHRAKDLVKQILTFSRQDESERKPIQVSPIVSDALKLLRASLPTTIEILQNEKVGVDTVSANPSQIHQIIMNLCTNAGYAMRENGGVLEVNLENVELDSSFTDLYPNIEPGSYLKIRTSDTGSGIPSQVLGRVFEPYFTTKEKGEGTGLGLAVAYGIVESYGGTITVLSVPGEGTTFDIYLPVTHEEQKQVEEIEGPMPTGTENILFVDDEEAIGRIAERMLGNLGYTVVVKTSSMQALGLFKTEPHRFDLVITDMTMSDMTGDKFAKEMMKIRSDIPVILCTGYSEHISEDKAKAMGIKAFIMKPFVMRDLAKIIRKVMDEKG